MGDDKEEFDLTERCRIMEAALTEIMNSNVYHTRPNMLAGKQALGKPNKFGAVLVRGPWGEIAEKALKEIKRAA